MVIFLDLSTQSEDMNHESINYTVVLFITADRIALKFYKH
jgi:hypothetical protein